MSNLKPLKWIDAKVDFNGIYIADTDSYIVNAVAYCHTLVTDYVISKRDDKFTVNYGGRTINEYDTLQDAKDWCEFTHYASKMSQYVEPPVGWISVDDRLPDVHSSQLIFNGYDITVNQWNKNGWLNVYEGIMVTHWMPLPKLPSEATR